MESPGKRWKVLVVDPYESLCSLYGTELASEGYQVHTASDVAAAMRILVDDPPDVVVMDLGTPGTGDLERLARMLRRMRSLPIILNTAWSSGEECSLPFVARLRKSSDLLELKRTIREVLGDEPTRPSRPRDIA